MRYLEKSQTCAKTIITTTSWQQQGGIDFITSQVDTGKLTTNLCTFCTFKLFSTWKCVFFVSFYLLPWPQQKSWLGGNERLFYVIFCLAIFFSSRKNQNNPYFFLLFPASMLKDGHAIRLIRFLKIPLGGLSEPNVNSKQGNSRLFAFSVITEIIKARMAWTEICNIFFSDHQSSLSNLRNVLCMLINKKQKLRPSLSLCHSKVTHFNSL